MFVRAVVTTQTRWHIAKTNWMEHTNGGRSERGEITSSTIMIALLAVAAVAVVGIIAARTTAHANNIPQP
jgi:hypothetical protein